MSNKIETPEFWEQVKDEFEASEDDHFICPASYVFLCEWNNQAEKIRELARGFLSNNLEWDRFHVWSCAFFGSTSLENGFLCGYREIRLAFLNYMIQKTKNNAEQGN